MYKRIVIAVTMFFLMLSLAPANPAASYTELLSNTDFESGVITPWAQNATGVTLSATTEDKYAGNYSLKVVNAAACGTANSNGAREGDTSFPIEVTGGEYYTLKGWVRAPSAGNSNLEYVWVRIRFYTATDYTGTAVDIPNSAGDNTSAGDAWSQFTLTAQAPASATRARVVLYVRQKSSTGGCSKPSGGDPFAYFDNLTLFRSAPTAISLRTLTARAPLSPLAALPVAGLALAGGAAAWRRRRTQGC